MVSTTASNSRHTPSPSVTAAGITLPHDQTAKDALNKTLVEHFGELTRLVDPTSVEGTRINQWLKEIGERLLAADATKLKHDVSYHLSDSKEPEAFVHMHDGEARIVVSKGLFSLIKNEDQLATIMAHELMHVRFREDLGGDTATMKNTKVEEYFADVASCATWVIEAGYAPRESIAVFDAMKEHGAKTDSRLLRPWTAYTDVHGLLENRAQAVSGLIAKELKEKGTVPVDITPISGEIKVALKTARHTSHFEKLKADPSYTTAPVEQRFRRLLDEMKQITSATSGRTSECLAEFKEVFKDLPITPVVIEEIYTALKENKHKEKTQILQEAYRACTRQGNKPILPLEIREIAQEIRTFVSSTSDQQLLASAKKIAAFSRSWTSGDPGVRAAIKGSFDLEKCEDGVVPWQQHLQLSRSSASRGDTSVIEAMWATGAYDARTLHFAPDELLSSFRETPQLTACKHAERYSIDPSGDWKRTPLIVKTDPLTVARQCYAELVTAEIKARKHARSLETNTAKLNRTAYTNLDAVPPEILARDVTGFIHLFSDELVHPNKVEFYNPTDGMVHQLNRQRARNEEQEESETEHDTINDGTDASEGFSDSRSLSVTAELQGHYASAVTLSKKFDAMLNHSEPEVRREAAKGIRSFFLNTTGPCFESLIGRFPVDEISTDKQCRHPLVTYVATCPALSAKERVDFLRGLEEQLSPALWNKAYFTGYDLTTPREKLRHLQSVAIHQESALRAGASLIAEHFTGATIKASDVIPFISEHKAFFPALRQLDDDARQAVLDHIESVTSWEAPLEHLIDAFWALEQAKLFPPTETGVRDALRKKIITGVEALNDPVARKEMAERVLLSPVTDTKRISEIGLPAYGSAQSPDAASKRKEMLNQSSALLSLKDPIARSAVTTIWADAVRELISKERPGTYNGRDDGSAEYITITKPRLSAIASDIRHRLPVQERRELLGALADTLELQDTLALFLRDSITEHSRATVADAHEYFRSAEAGFEFINQDAWRREAVIQFLSQPLTPPSLERFARRADISRNRELTALTDTVEQILGRYEADLGTTQSRIRFIERTTDDKKWLGTLYSKASDDLLEHIDKHVGHPYHGDALAESLEGIMPQAIPDDARRALTHALQSKDDDLFFTPQQAKELIQTSAAGINPALRQALEQEKIIFETTLQKGLEQLQQLPSNSPKADVDTGRKSLLQALANLPEYDFVGGLEDRITAARSHTALVAVITKSLEGLAKSFERERVREEARFDKEFAKLVRDIDKNRVKLEKFEQSRPVFLQGFYTQLRAMLTSPKISIAKAEFPELYRVIETPLEQLHTEHDENEGWKVSEALARLRGKLFQQQEALVEKERVLQAQVEALTELDGKIRSEISTLRKTPTPVNTILEEALESLHGVELEDSGETQPSYDNFAEMFLEDFNRDYPRNRRDSELPLSPLEEQHARQFYEIFWSQSAEVRSVALKLLLIPPEAEYQDRKSGKNDHFNKAFEFVAEQIFPQGMKYGTESKKILRIFLEETDPSLRGFMLAALMAASEKVAGAPEEYSAGKRLAMILSMLGPAEKKLGQAINSHPLTPEDLRSDTKSIKSMSDPLPRWDLLERIAEAVPEAYKDAALPRIGSTLGAASYYIAVDCNDSVLSILRPHARELARTGLDRMEAIAIRLSHDAQLKHVAVPFIESIQQARQMIALETDHEKGVIQQANAWNRYEGLSITIDHETFNFHTAAWKGCGPEFRHQQKVDGEHFLDIWERDQATDPFTRKAALAHITAELLNILSGQPFDHDRHGSQSKISRGDRTHTIGLFDHGCMALEAPSPQEKEQLATVLCDLVEGYLQGKTGLLERAHSIIKERREKDGVAPAYLVSVERALLALNDFMRFDGTGESTLLKRSDLGAAIAAVFRTGQVDPIFSSTIAQRFAGPTASMFLQFLSPAQLCTKIAEKIEEQAKVQPSITISRGQARLMPEPIVFGDVRAAA